MNGSTVETPGGKSPGLMALRFCGWVLAVALAASSAFGADLNWACLRDGMTSGDPPARFNAVSWKGPDGSAYVFGAHESNDMWRYAPDTNEWFVAKPGQETSYGTCGVASPMNAPSPRGGSVSWTGPNGKLYLFGGYGEPASCPQGYGNDLWSYDVGTNEWTWLKGSSSPNQVGVYGTQGVAAPENTPGARDQAVSWTGADGCLYLFGGTGFAVSGSGTLNDLWRYDVSANQWTWLKGSSSTGQSGVYGNQGISAPGNVPGARGGAVSWTGPDGALYLFGGYDGVYASGLLSDLWRYDVATNQWAWLKGTAEEAFYGTQGVAAPQNTPGMRSDSVAWTGSDGSLYLFGGNAWGETPGGFWEFAEAVRHKNDLWRYDIDTNQWTWLKGSQFNGQSGVYGTRGVAAPENTPAPRQGAVSWTGTDGSLYLFGGGDDRRVLSDYGYHGCMNDLWRYDVAAGEWTWVRGSSSTDQYGVYGTPGTAGLVEDAPGARSGAVSWTGSDGFLYLFGGYGYAAAGDIGYLNDLWRYDVETGLWTWLSGSSSSGGEFSINSVETPENVPVARKDSVSWTGSDGSLYLFGGSGSLSPSDIQYLNDLWRFDVGSSQWVLIRSNSSVHLGVYGTQGVAAADNTPGARSGAVAWTGSDGSYYLFGGYGYAGSGNRGNLNDLWRYDAGGNEWMWLRGSESTSQSGVYGTQGQAASENTPGARYKAVSWTGMDGLLYVFGGQAGQDRYLNDLWCYDVGSNEWMWLKGSDSANQHGVYGVQGVAAPQNVPGARQEAVSWTGVDGALYLFGGLGCAVSVSGVLDDLWRYDAATNQWVWLQGPSSGNRSGVYGTHGVAASGNTPGARSASVVWARPDGAVYLFGGQGFDLSEFYGSLNDLWRFGASRLDLAVSVSAKSEVLVGEDYWYSIHVHNNGPDTAHDVTLSTSAPVELLFIDANASTGTVTRGSDGNVIAQLGTLAADESATVAVRLLARSAGTFDFEAFAGCSEGDLNTSNNLAVASTHVSVGPGPDLQARWSGVRTTHRRARAGTAWQIRGMLTVANTGDRIARKSNIQVFLTDTPSLPPDLTPQITLTLDPIKMRRYPSGTFAVNLPVNVSPAGKYLIAVVDSDNTVAESNEFNNVCAFGPLQ